VLRKAGPSQSPVLRTNLFVAGYLLVWTAFSAVATLAQALTAHLAWTNPMMEAASPWFGAAVMLAAGAWQFTAAKRACLTHCRAPALFIAEHWRPGATGALRMGVAHGAYCVGCCWAAMALLFVGGVMNLAVIAAITLFVLLEKVAPLGVRGGQVAGALLVLGGLWIAARAATGG
jgi:predicted metal-binding membrane protein